MVTADGRASVVPHAAPSTRHTIIEPAEETVSTGSMIRTTNAASISAVPPRTVIKLARGVVTEFQKPPPKPAYIFLRTSNLQARFVQRQSVYSATDPLPVPAFAMTPDLTSPAFRHSRCCGEQAQ